jgi:DNA replication protein DnaC
MENPQNLRPSGEGIPPAQTRLETSGCLGCGEPYTAEEVLVGESWVRMETRCEPCKGIKLATGHVIAATPAQLPPMQERFNPKPCPRCGVPYNAVEREWMPGRWVCFETQCETCDDADRVVSKERVGAYRTARRKAIWESRCPAYHRTEGIVAACSKTLRDALRDRVMVQGQGALIYGPTGTFKTTAAYHGAVKALIWAGQEVRVARATEWRLEMSLAAKESRLPQALRKWKQCDWLFFDDLGQAAGTETGEEALYELVEMRRATGRPMIITTQYSDDDFLARFKSQHRGEAIAQRIAELTSAADGIFKTT